MNKKKTATKKSTIGRIDSDAKIILNFVNSCQSPLKLKYEKIRFFIRLLVTK